MLTGSRLFAAIVLLTAWTPAASAADLAEVEQRGRLQVIVMPLSGEDEFVCAGCDRAGFDLELLQGFAKLHDVGLELVPVQGWGNLIPALLEGRGGLIAGRFTLTPARQALVSFTTQVFPTRNVVLTRAPTSVVESLEQLRQHRVGTIKGSSMAEAVARAGVPAENVDNSIAPGGLPGALSAGKVSAVVLGIESAVAAQRDDAALQIGLFLGSPGSLAYAVRKRDATLLAALNQYIENVRRTATWSRLTVKYFGESALDILKQARTE